MHQLGLQEVNLTQILMDHVSGATFDYETKGPHNYMVKALAHSWSGPKFIYFFRNAGIGSTLTA